MSTEIEIKLIEEREWLKRSVNLRKQIMQEREKEFTDAKLEYDLAVKNLFTFEDRIQTGSEL